MRYSKLFPRRIVGHTAAYKSGRVRPLGMGTAKLENSAPEQRVYCDGKNLTRHTFASKITSKVAFYKVVDAQLGWGGQYSLYIQGSRRGGHDNIHFMMGLRDAGRNMGIRDLEVVEDGS